MLYYVFITIFASLENLSPWYSLICLFPVHFSGGISSYLAVVSCYISDLTRDNSRGMRMGIAEAALFMGVFLGTVSSSYLLAATNYATVFLFSAICCFLSVAFIACFVPESLPHPESEGRFKGLFQLSNLDEMLKITFKKRQNYERCTIICCVLMVIVSVVARNGNSAVIFLFLREKFHWSLQTYTLFSAAGSVTSVFGTLIGLYFLHKLMKIPETVLILVAFISSLNGALVLGWAENNTSVYSVPFIQLLGGMFGPMVRSLVSKIIPNEEVGKILALVSAAQFFFGMAGSPIYSAIYNKTISTHSEIFNFVTAGFYVFEILITMYVLNNIKLDQKGLYYTRKLF
jgi:PCFT/HCP family folate transporter-like MFS transporter 1/3